MWNKLHLFQLNMKLCQYTTRNANTSYQRTNRKNRREKPEDYQLGHTSVGQEGQCHWMFEGHLLWLDSSVLQEIL